jgi:hypothetical protein
LVTQKIKAHGDCGRKLLTAGAAAARLPLLHGDDSSGGLGLVLIVLLVLVVSGRI